VWDVVAVVHHAKILKTFGVIANGGAGAEIVSIAERFGATVLRVAENAYGATYHISVAAEKRGSVSRAIETETDAYSFYNWLDDLHVSALPLAESFADCANDKIGITRDELKQLKEATPSIFESLNFKKFESRLFSQKFESVSPLMQMIRAQGNEIKLRQVWRAAWLGKDAQAYLKIGDIYAQADYGLAQDNPKNLSLMFDIPATLTVLQNQYLFKAHGYKNLTKALAEPVHLNRMFGS
jgi:hypothetical protein